MHDVAHAGGEASGGRNCAHRVAAGATVFRHARLVQGEDEVLLAAGSTFIITSINLWQHGITEVRLKEIDDTGGRTPASIDESVFNPMDVLTCTWPSIQKWTQTTAFTTASAAIRKSKCTALTRIACLVSIYIV